MRITPEEHKKMLLQPRDLTPKEMEDPYIVLHDFFSSYHIDQARDSLWELLRAAIVGDFKKQSLLERSGIVFTYSQLKKVVEAIHIICTERSKPKAVEVDNEVIEEERPAA